VRYFHNEPILHPGAARSSFAGAGGSIVYCLARRHDFIPGESALLQLLGRYRPHLRMTLDRIARLPGGGLSRRAVCLLQSRNLSRSARDDAMADFCIRMINTLRFSSCAAPHIPTSKPHEETLIVELLGDRLTITEGRANGGLGSRIYAQRSVDLPGATIFTILPELPPEVRDGSFFSALGTVAILAARCGGPRRLRAVGTDKNSGQCHGWIFDATEA
jgi:hypothetical protein